MSDASATGTGARTGRVRRWLDDFEDWAGGYADFGPAVFRIGLGAVILLAGLHKIVAPGAWTPYFAPAFVAVWPVSVDATMVVFGLTEVPFGLLLLADRYTTVAAAVVAVSMLGTVGDLALAAVGTGRFVDVLVRDIGLLALAVGVTLQSAGEAG